MKICVTGGAGYIGSHFCKAAALAGHDLTVIDDLSTGHREFAKWGQLHECSVLDTNRVHEILRKIKVEAIVHFAGKSLVGESVANPDLYQRVNVGGARSLLTASEGASVQYFLFSSTAAVYGEPETSPIDECAPTKPINPYGTTKLTAEELLLSAKSLRVGVLRYFNVIGQDPEGDVFEKHEPETHLVPNILKALRENQEFSVFGNDYRTTDGTCVRDYVDVNDLAQVHLEALDYLEENEEHLISNVGRGKGDTVLQVLSAFEKVFGRSPKVEIKPRRPGDPAKLVASAEYFKTWCPVTLRPLEESLQNLRR